MSDRIAEICLVLSLCFFLGSLCGGIVWLIIAYCMGLPG